MRVRTADFTTDHADIRRIRFAVFVAEQQVPAQLELDDRDVHCTHALAFDGAGVAIATGRIDVDGKIGRVAVTADARRTGAGRAIMEHLHRIALERGMSQVWCNAQVGAEPFYNRLGYRTSGPRFYEAGIEHVRMHKAL
jgi:predicted GNAT family N-acyltransferase